MGGTRPLRNVLGEAIEGRFSFEARNYLFSFRSCVCFEEFFVSRAFERFGAKCSSSGAFGFGDVLGLFLKTPLRHLAFFCELLLRPQVFLENFLSFFFPKQSRFYLPDSFGVPKSEQSTLVMVRRNQNENSTSGRWRNRAQKDHRSSSRLVQVVCDDP